MKKALLGVVVSIVLIVAVLGVVIAGGLYNVAADEEHTSLVYSVIETARERSIAVRASDVDVPDLADPQRIRRGAGNYDSMCAGCHLAPGVKETEISRGLYPAPPNLANAKNVDPARAFWIIKHGIKTTGMPAWGKSMEDQYIWDMVAFLREMPGMTADKYASEVRESEGHSHGGSESSGEHEHEDDEHGSESEEGHSHSDSADESGSGARDHSHVRADAHSHASRNAPVETSLPSAVLETAKAFHAALSAGDTAAVQSLLDPNVLIMEGGNVERSRDEYAAHHLKSDAKFMRSVKYTLERQTGEGIGDLAWVASEATLAGESQGKATNLVSTESLVLKKRTAGWRIVHIHWSSRARGKA